MKMLPTLTLVFVCLCGFRFPDGDLISRGDPADKILIKLGQPHSVTTTRAVSPYGGSYVIREVWVYRLRDGYTYRFVVEGGRLVSESWNR